MARKIIPGSGMTKAQVEETTPDLGLCALSGRRESNSRSQFGRLTSQVRPGRAGVVGSGLAIGVELWPSVRCENVRPSGYRYLHPQRGVVRCLLQVTRTTSTWWS